MKSNYPKPVFKVPKVKGPIRLISEKPLARVISPKTKEAVRAVIGLPGQMIKNVFMGANDPTKNLKRTPADIAKYGPKK